jgi:hypothetical protein
MVGHLYLAPIYMILRFCRIFIFFVSLILISEQLIAQEDSTIHSLRDSTFLLRSKKGIFKKLGDAIWIDAPQFEVQNTNSVFKNEFAFEKFKGKIINQIQISSVSYETSFTDTMQSGKKIKRAVEEVLYNSTTNKTMLRNLFFTTGDTLYPYLIADNEKFLRELAFIQDARIIASIDPADSNGVVINIQWKDIFPFGGSANLGSLQSFNAEVNHNNLLGLGDKIQINALYDLDRRPLAATGFEYIKRNLFGSFLNLTVGIDKFKPAFNSGRREEHARYIKGELPLVSPYHSFTGGFEFGKYEANNNYNTLLSYQHHYKYAYGIMDGWMGINIGAGLRIKDNLQTRLRKFISFRAVSKRFSHLPDTAILKYNIHYSNIDAGLIAFNIFKQEYYHTNYIYGFGRNEDVPEGYNLSVVSGLTQRNSRTRPYIGIDYERDYFTNQENYTNFILKLGGYMHNGSLEDISFLSSLNYFTALKKLSNPKWSKRNFVELSATQQLNTILNEPLFLRSEFGIPTFRNDNIQAATRVSCNLESVYYNMVKYYGFSFAPFVFVNTSYIKLIGEAIQKGSIYTALGLGCRTRNENLVFGTIELKAYYYPRTISNMTPLNVTLTTGLRFRYNSRLIRRPDFVQLN